MKLIDIWYNIKINFKIKYINFFKGDISKVVIDYALQSCLVCIDFQNICIIIKY